MAVNENPREALSPISKLGWPRAIELGLLTVAALASAYSAQQSHAAIEGARDQNANTVLFQSRLDAQQRYIQAYGELDTALQLMTAESTEAQFDFEETASIERASVAQLARAAKVAKASIPALGDYRRNVNASRGVWPAPIEAKILHAYEDAVTATACYSVAASPPMNESELPAERRAMLDNCKLLLVKYKDFRDASNDVVNSMVIATRGTLSGVGVDPVQTDAVQPHKHP